MISIAHPLLGEEEEVAILRVRASNQLAYLAKLDLFHEQSIAHARFLTADPSNFIQMPGSRTGHRHVHTCLSWKRLQGRFCHFQCTHR